MSARISGKGKIKDKGTKANETKREITVKLNHPVSYLLWGFGLWAKQDDVNIRVERLL